MEATQMIPTTPTAHPAAERRESPDLEGVKLRQKAAWSTGDYAVIGTRLQIVGESLCEAADLRSGERVLDVAAGNGNAALAAARRFCRVTALDYVPALLDRARARAGADGLELEALEGDAERMPLPDGAFDAVLSTFGVMFAPDQERAARELVRVCRPGGRIALASWTPDGFIGHLFRTMAAFVPPAPGVLSPALWGTEARLRELFGDAARALRAERRTYLFRFLSAAHWIDVFRRWYGPVHKTFAALPDDRQPELERALAALLARFDRGAGRGLVAEGEYLEALVTLR